MAGSRRRQRRRRANANTAVEETANQHQGTDSRDDDGAYAVTQRSDASESLLRRDKEKGSESTESDSEDRPRVGDLEDEAITIGHEGCVSGGDDGRGDGGRGDDDRSEDVGDKGQNVVRGRVAEDDEEEDDDADFPDSDMEADEGDKEMNDYDDNRKCDFCGKTVPRDRWVKCTKCFRVVYCGDRCLSNGQLRHGKNCVKLPVFRSVESFVQQDAAVRVEKLKGRDLETLTRVPSLGQASLGGSKATVLLEVGRKHETMKQAVYARDVSGTEAIVSFNAKSKIYKLCKGRNQVTEVNIRDALKRSNFVLVFAACWTLVKPGTRVLEVDDVGNARFYSLTFEQ